MGLETILGLVFSKFGGILAAVAGVLFFFWRHNALTKKADRLEAERLGVQVTQGAAKAGAQISQGVQREQDEIDEAVAKGDYGSLQDRYNRGDGPPPDR